MPLNPEKAQEQLEKCKDSKREAKCLERVRALPAGLSAAAFGLLGRAADGKDIRDWQKSNKARREAAAAIDKLPAAQRAKLFAAFFPHLGKYFAAVWEMFPRLPFQDDYERRAFRAPNSPALYAGRKGSWFSGVYGELNDYKDELLTLPWVATWAPYMGYGGADDVGLLLAAGIEAGGKEGEEVFDILKESAAGRHPTGAMGKHVTRALLVADRKDGWEFVEKMLLAAQRQEGLRQAILETVDEAHPEAFRRMVDLILDKDLARFSSVVQAVDVWFGFELETISAGKVKKILAQVSTYLKDAKARKAALADPDPQALAPALSVAAFEDAAAAAGLAGKIARDKSAGDRRLAAVHFLQTLNTPATLPHLLPLLEDPDVKVALAAYAAADALDNDDVAAAAPDLFERLERLASRAPEKKTRVEWPGYGVVEDLPNREDVADALDTFIGKRPKNRLVPYLRWMSTWQRSRLVGELAKGRTIDAATRKLFFELVSDRSADVREAALAAVAKCRPTPEEVRSLEPMLSRKTESTRRAVLALVLKQKPATVLETTDRLLASRNANIRLGGLEVLRQLARGKQLADEARRLADTYRATRGKLTADEKRQVEQILRVERVEAKPDDAFGLCDLSKRTVPTKPTVRKVKFITPATVGLLKALDELVHEHRENMVRYKDREGEREEPLGAVEYNFPSPDRDKSPEEDAARLPLRELWEKFWAERPKELRDADGFELTRALALVNLSQWDWQRAQQEARSPALKKLKELVFGDFKYKEPKYEQVVDEVIDWLHRLHPPTGEVDYLLDGLETVYAHLSADELRESKKKKGRRFPELANVWRSAVNRSNRAGWTAEQKRRHWDLEKWWDEPAERGAIDRDRPGLDLTLDAYANGWANEADLMDLLLGPRPGRSRYYDKDADPLLTAEYDDLKAFTDRTPPRQFRVKPELAALADRVRAHVLELELARGEAPTPATPAAHHLGALFGADTLLRLLGMLGDKPLKRSSSYYWRPANDRTQVLTDLIEKTHPGPADTPAAFAAAVRAVVAAGTFPPERLLELAFLAPQWLPFVEKALGWAGASEGVWWFLAHMPGGHEGVIDEESDGGGDADDFDDEDGEREEKPSAWERLIRQRTPLTQTERAEGGVDVQWFHRTYVVVGPDRWAELSAAAKYGGSGQEHRKPILLGDVLLGKAKKADIVAAIARRRLRESVRLLGLMPLAAGDKREADLRERYEVLQEYAKYARSLGSMSRASAVRAAEIGIANLARTAGFPDAVRFEWEMEAQSVADLAAGPQSATVSGVTVTLALDDGKPVLTVAKGGKPLKAIPPAVKKHEKVAELADRKQHLTRQGSRVRKSLEAMMCRGDEFTGEELKKLMTHPLIAPLLGRLVVVGEGVAGYPAEGGKALETHAGKLEPVKKGERLRIAHPTDLYTAGEWEKWQHDCFARERVQPFKQVFRELYLLTDQEKADGNVSHRYAGQQVQPRKGAALLNGRGWSTEDYTRMFHEAGIRCTFTVRFGGWTPLDVEGWTLEDIRFFRRDVWEPMPLAEVPPRVFSEAMRDLDLVVSVAHAGQVDPEASASTVEMRAALVRETSRLLRMSNVRVERSHAFVDGQLGRYSVHLGSGTVHRLPGGSVCIVPVHAQHRGRLFLPFADDDPRTAEVTSKVLLLARDNEIQDPTILQQLLSN
jgi:hypothetical protein